MVEFIIEFWPYLIFIFAITSVGGYGLFSHAVKHTDGTDDIQTADGEQKGLMSSTHHSDIETLKSDLDAAEADIDAAEADIDAAEADIITLDTDLAVVEAEIEAAKGSKASVDARLDVGIAEDGSLKGSLIKAKAYLSTTQSNLPDNTWTRINLNVESYDPSSIYDNTVNFCITFPVPGFYLLCYGIGIYNLVGDKRYTSRIRLNGAADLIIREFCSGASVAGDYPAWGGSDIIHFSLNDVIELQMRSKAGVDTVDVNFGKQMTFMSVHLLSLD